MFGRKKQEIATTQSLIPFYEAEVARLESKLVGILAETEALTKLRHAEWKGRKAETRKTWLEHGVTVPETTHEKELDKMFREMERRMRNEEAAALGRIRKHREIERGHELEMQRIEAQKAIGFAVAQALHEDLED